MIAGAAWQSLFASTTLALVVGIVVAGPLALAGVGLVPRRTADRHASLIAWFARAVAAITAATGAVTAIAVVVLGPLRTPAFGIDGVGFAFYADALSATMFALVSLIGAVVVTYSRNYLDGDPRHGSFTKWLCLTLASVLVLIISGNVFQFALAWVATSYGLHQLLLFYRERPAAVLAARKKFLASRIGDACLVGGMLLLHGVFGSLDYATVLPGAEQMRYSGHVPPEMGAVAVLLVLAALLKSAQFPVHGWLLEVMETPTPVSALLHAGVINAGGFLVLRFADVISLSAPALDTLAIVGGLTALFGSVVMLTQTSIKVSLAYSTIAQMGFMMLECGLGAFSAALLHIAAHSLYKAHAFLSSGSVIDLARASWSVKAGGKPHPARLVVAVAAAVAIILVVSLPFGATVTQKPGVFALGTIVLLGLIHLIANAIEERPNAYVIGRTLAFAALVTIAYFGLQVLAERLLAGTLPPTQPLRGPLDLVIVGGVLLSFAAVTVLQGLLPYETAKSNWQALYVHTANGFYVNTFANRLVLRFWSGPPPKPSAPSHQPGTGTAEAAKS